MLAAWLLPVMELTNEIEIGKTEVSPGGSTFFVLFSISQLDTSAIVINFHSILGEAAFAEERSRKMKTMMSWGNKNNDVWTESFVSFPSTPWGVFLPSYFNFMIFGCAYFFRHYNGFSVSLFRQFLSCNVFSPFLLSWRKRLEGALCIIFFIIIFFCTLFVVIIFWKVGWISKEVVEKRARR